MLPSSSAHECHRTLAVMTNFPRRAGGAPCHENLLRRRCTVPRLDNETGAYLHVPIFLRNKANTTPSPPRDHIVADDYKCDEMKRLRLKSVRPRRSAEREFPRPAARQSGYTAKNGEEQHSSATRVSVRVCGGELKGCGSTWTRYWWHYYFYIQN